MSDIRYTVSVFNLPAGYSVKCWVGVCQRDTKTLTLPYQWYVPIHFTWEYDPRYFAFASLDQQKLFNVTSKCADLNTWRLAGFFWRCSPAFTKPWFKFPLQQTHHKLYTRRIRQFEITLWPQRTN